MAELGPFASGPIARVGRGLNLHFDELLRDGLSKATHLAAMVVDLDRFKDINDTFGHTTGDAVLMR